MSREPVRVSARAQPLTVLAVTHTHLAQQQIHGHLALACQQTEHDGSEIHCEIACSVIAELYLHTSEIERALHSLDQLVLAARSVSSSHVVSHHVPLVNRALLAHFVLVLTRTLIAVDSLVQLQYTVVALQHCLSLQYTAVH